MAGRCCTCGGDTTKLTAALAVGGLLGFWLASRILSRGADPFRMASVGALVGVPAFCLVILSAPAMSQWLFGLGTLLIGFGAGLFGHGTLTATMNLAPKGQSGLALGAWAPSRPRRPELRLLLGASFANSVAGYASATAFGAASAYDIVYAIEIVLLLATLVLMSPLIRRAQAYA